MILEGDTPRRAPTLAPERMTTAMSDPKQCWWCRYWHRIDPDGDWRAGECMNTDGALTGPDGETVPRGPGGGQIMRCQSWCGAYEPSDTAREAGVDHGG